jgi:sterol desaturase/sphingolipid hydroxylase (fatty acid hydroxylase superfamily)
MNNRAILQSTTMKYFREFMAHGLIVFLTGLLLLNAVAVVILPYSPMVWAYVAIGIAIFGISEYVVHRYLLHQFPKLMPKAYQGHVAHHDFPTDEKYLFGPIGYDAVSYSIVYILLWALTGKVSTVFALVLGVCLCQFYYQWKHYVSHRPIVPVTPWGRWLKKKHLLHHYLDEHSWYGVSNPVMDYLLGTGSMKGKGTPLGGGGSGDGGRPDGVKLGG